MSSRSISPSLPCDNGSELSSSMNEDVPEVLVLKGVYSIR